MRAVKDRFIRYEEAKGVRPLKDCYIVRYVRNNAGEEEMRYIPITSLRIGTGEQRDAKQVTRRVRSMQDFRTNFNAKNVYWNDFATPGDTIDREIINATEEILVDTLKIPTDYTTTSANAVVSDETRAKVAQGKPGQTPEEIAENVAKLEEMSNIPYGLKRTLPVETVPFSNADYVYCKIDGEWGFAKTTDLTFVQDAQERRVSEIVDQGVEYLEDYTVYDSQGRAITEMYGEHGFVLQLPTMYETVDVENMKRITHTINANAEESTKSVDIPTKYSMQRFITREEPVGRTGKMKPVSYVKTKNYHITEGGPYLAVYVNGQITMVNEKDLITKDGAAVDLKNKDGSFNSELLDVGKPIYFRDGAEIVKSDPLTFEQYTFRYATRKTYQPTASKDPTDDTYLRIDTSVQTENGDLADRYIKEMESVQPLCFTLVDNTDSNFDKYLVKQTIDGAEKWVVVEKEFLHANTRKSMFDMSSVRKLRRCDYNARNCHIVQSTSSAAQVEDCKIVSKDIADQLGADFADKKEEFTKFVEDYKQGKYQVNDVYLNGKLVKLAGDKTRYEYTDEAEMPDYADNLIQYKALKAVELSMDGGKAKGGAKFDTVGAMMGHYSRLWNVFMYGGVYLTAAGFFMPALAPLIVPFLAGCGVVALAVPLLSVGQAIIKNKTLSKMFQNLKRVKPHDKLIVKAAEITGFKDKTKYNRKQEEKAIKKELKNLFKQVKRDKAIMDKQEKLSQRIDKLSNRLAEKPNKLLSFVLGKMQNVQKRNERLNSNQFNDAMSRLMHRINNFAETGSNAVSKVKGGKVKVDANNANLANAFQAEYNQLSAKIGKTEKAIKKCFSKDGSTLKPGKMKKHEKLTHELEELKSKQKRISDQTLGTSYKADPRGAKLEGLAEDLRLFEYFQQHSKRLRLAKVNDKGEVIREEISDKEAEKLMSRISWSKKKGLLIDGKHWDKESNNELVLTVQEILEEIKSETTAEKCKAREPLSERVQEKGEVIEQIVTKQAENEQAIEEIEASLTKLEGYAVTKQLNAQLAESKSGAVNDESLASNEFSVEELQENLQTLEGAGVPTEVQKQVERVVEVDKKREDYLATSTRWPKDEDIPDDVKHCAKSERKTLYEKIEADDTKKYGSVDEFETLSQTIDEQSGDVDKVLAYVEGEIIKSSSESVQKLINQTLAKASPVDAVMPEAKSNLSEYSAVVKNLQTEQSENDVDAVQETREKVQKIQELSKEMVHATTILEKYINPSSGNATDEILVAAERIKKAVLQAGISDDVSLEELSTKVTDIKSQLALFDSLLAKGEKIKEEKKAAEAASPEEQPKQPTKKNSKKSKSAAAVDTAAEIAEP